MNYIELIAKILQFLGAVLISLDLIRSPEQIADETAQYWGNNPYLKNSTTQALRYVQLGFLLLILGFAIDVSSLFSASIIIQVLISFLLSIFGICILILKYIIQFGRHRQLKQQVQLINAIELINTVSGQIINRNIGINQVNARRENMIKQMRGNDDYPIWFVDKYEQFDKKIGLNLEGEVYVKKVSAWLEQYI